MRAALAACRGHMAMTTTAIGRCADTSGTSTCVQYKFIILAEWKNEWVGRCANRLFYHQLKNRHRPENIRRGNWETTVQYARMVLQSGRNRAARALIATNQNIHFNSCHFARLHELCQQQLIISNQNRYAENSRFRQFGMQHICVMYVCIVKAAGLWQQENIVSLVENSHEKTELSRTIVPWQINALIRQIRAMLFRLSKIVIRHCVRWCVTNK